MFRLLFISLVFFSFFSSAQEAETLANLQKAREYQKDNRLPRAIRYYESALQTARNGTKDSLFLSLLNETGLAYLNVGKYKEAGEAFREYLEIEPDNSGVKGNLGLVLHQLADYDSALSLINEAIKALSKQKGPSHRDVLDLVNRQALIYFQKGQYKRAERIYQLGINQMLNQRMSTTAEFAFWLNNMAVYYERIGRYLRAKEFYEKALDIQVRLAGDQSVEVAFTKNNLGYLLAKSGDFIQSQHVLDESADVLRRGHPNYFVVLDNQGLVQFYKGNYQKANEWFDKSLELKREILGEQHPSLAISYKYKSRLMSALGNHAQAISMIENAIEIEEKIWIQSHPTLLDSYFQLSLTCFSAGMVEKSEKILSGILPELSKRNTSAHPKVIQAELLHTKIMVQKGKHRESVQSLQDLLQKMNSTGNSETRLKSDIYSDLSLVYRLSGDQDRSLMYIDSAIQIVGNSLGQSHPRLAKLYIQRASIVASKGKVKKAFDDFNLALDNYSSQIKNHFPFLIESEKVQFYELIKDDFDKYQSFLWENWDQLPGAGEKLIQYRLLTKALLLNSATRWKSNIRNSGDVNLIREFSQWQTRKHEWLEWSNLNGDELEEKGIDLGKEKNEIDELERKLLSMSQHFAGWNQDKEIVGYQEIKSHLKAEETAIEIIRFRHFDFQKDDFDENINYSAVVIRPDQVAPQLIGFSDPVNLETRYLKRYRNSVILKLEDNASFDVFWQPLDKVIPKGSTVYLSADGAFHLINFNTLYNPISEKFVLEEYHIHLLTNLKDLMQPERGVPSRSMALLVGNPDFGSSLSPLPGTEEEIRNLQYLLEDFDWEVEVLMEGDATESNLREAYRPRLLHVATHGFFETMKDTPGSTLTRSGLMMAGAGDGLSQLALSVDAENDDGLLTSGEAMSLNVDNTDLVVLSACETGLGEIQNGEGVNGLQRSFLVAGTQNLIMSLWKVDDEATQELMDEFYQNWFGGMGKFEAFKEAQLTLQEKYPEPYYWGAFVFLGR